MKVNKLEEQRTTCIEELLVGQTFTAPRTRINRYSEPATGYYMKIDKSSGILTGVRKDEVVAINLETGQLRKFDRQFLVAATTIECNIVKED